MSTMLLQIAKELAVTNPGATANDISEAIINTIESEDALDIILGVLRLSSSHEISVAKMKMARSRRKEAGKIESKLELTALIDGIKSGLNKDTCSSVIRRTFGDGNKVVPESVTHNIMDGNSRFPRTPSFIAISKQDLRITSARSSKNYYLNLPRETEKHESFQHIVSLEMLLDDISHKIADGQTLLFDDISKVLLMVEHSNDSTYLMKLNKVLQSDIDLRKTVFKVDCLQALYEGDESVSDEKRTHHLAPHNIKDRVNERIRAILLHEQRRLHREASLNFLSGQSTYANYVDSSRRYALDASRLYPAEP